MLHLQRQSMVDAWQLPSNEAGEGGAVTNELMNLAIKEKWDVQEDGLYITNADGEKVFATPGDWIVKLLETGTFFVLSDAEFTLSYYPVVAEGSSQVSLGG